MWTLHESSKAENWAVTSEIALSKATLLFKGI